MAVLFISEWEIPFAFPELYNQIHILTICKIIHADIDKHVRIEYYTMKRVWAR